MATEGITSGSGSGALSGDLDAVAVRVEDDAFVAAVAGMARLIDHLEAVIAQPLRESVDALLRADRQGQVGKPHALRAAGVAHRLEPRAAHEFQPRTARKAQKTRLEALRLVEVAGARACAEIFRIEAGETLE